MSPDGSDAGAAAGLLAGYRRLAALLRLVVSEREVEEVLTLIAKALAELVPADDLVVWDRRDEQLLPLLAEGIDADTLRATRVRLGDGLTGLAALSGTPVRSNQAHLDPRARLIPGTERLPEAIICLPLLARERVIGVISLYRSGTDAAFGEHEYELAGSFAEVAAIALDNARTHQQLEQLATTDDLTGIANRRHFHRELARELAAATRYRQPLSLLLIDLDDFKTVNDVHGHEHGDRLLESVAHLLNRHIRESDLIARIGGDEFALLLPHTTRPQAHTLARRLRHAIRRHTPPPRISASIGIATLDSADSAEQLLRRADQNLYTAKHRARPGRRLPASPSPPETAAITRERERRADARA